mmetsp:Transcript_28661/g.60771  ORF Transcript_28661/g.60771 Transcript_28661/m.60771 type:complete len:289 (+) Transcript_28661:1846-2712(+)
MDDDSGEQTQDPVDDEVREPGAFPLRVAASVPGLQEVINTGPRFESLHKGLCGLLLAGVAQAYLHRLQRHISTMLLGLLRGRLRLPKLLLSPGFLPLPLEELYLILLHQVQMRLLRRRQDRGFVQSLRPLVRNLENIVVDDSAQAVLVVRARPVRASVLVQLLDSGVLVETVGHLEVFLLTILNLDVANEHRIMDLFGDHILLRLILVVEKTCIAVVTLFGDGGHDGYSVLEDSPNLIIHELALCLDAPSLGRLRMEALGGLARSALLDRMLVPDILKLQDARLELIL